VCPAAVDHDRSRTWLDDDNRPSRHQEELHDLSIRILLHVNQNATGRHEAAYVNIDITSDRLRSSWQDPIHKRNTCKTFRKYQDKGEQENAVHSSEMDRSMVMRVVCSSSGDMDSSDLFPLTGDVEEVSGQASAGLGVLDDQAPTGLEGARMPPCSRLRRHAPARQRSITTSSRAAPIVPAHDRLTVVDHSAVVSVR
jgi:hypothetical protein